MLSELHSAHKVIGVKQTKKAIKDGKAAMVYVALDAEKRVTGPIYELCTENHVQMVEITTWLSWAMPLASTSARPSSPCSPNKPAEKAKTLFHIYF